MNITIDAPFAEAAEVFEEFAASVYPQVENSALNEATAQSRTRIVRGTKQRTGVPTKTLNRRIKLHRAKRNHRQGSARLFIGTLPVSVYPYLNARELKRGGVSYAGPSGRRRDPKGFIETVRGGQMRALKRRGQARYPLQNITISVYRPAREVTDQVNRDFFPEAYDRLFASKFSFRMGKVIAKHRRIRLL